MSATRRSFLAYLGVGSSAAPLAAKAAIEEAGIGVSSLRPMLAPALAPGSPAFNSPSGGSYEESLANAITYIKAFGIPKHILFEMLAESQHVQALDPDLAFAKRSWSMNVKIAEQRRRNYERKVGEYMQRADNQLARQVFHKTTGWYWPW